MSTRRPPGEDSDPVARDHPREPWRWSLDSPLEVARVARLLTQSDRVAECVSTGNSMGATLPAGTRLRFRCGRSDPKPGDVVVVLAGPSELIVHRVVALGWGPRARGHLLTRGDNSILCDQPVALDAVLGIVEECRRGDEWVSIGPPTRRKLSAAVTAALLEAVMVGAFALGPRVATWVALGSYSVSRRVRALGTSATTSP